MKVSTLLTYIERCEKILSHYPEDDLSTALSKVLKLVETDSKKVSTKKKSSTKSVKNFRKAEILTKKKSVSMCDEAESEVEISQKTTDQEHRLDSHQHFLTTHIQKILKNTKKNEDLSGDFFKKLEEMPLSELEFALNNSKLFPTVVSLRDFAAKLNIAFDSSSKRATIVHTLLKEFERSQIEKTISSRDDGSVNKN